MSFDDQAWRLGWLRGLQRRAHARADRARIKFDLKDPDYTVKLYESQNGRCSVSGITFTLERFEDALVKHPFQPSLDRKESSGGYTEDNVRLVCVAVNFGMNQWGEAVFLKLARAAVEYQPIVTPTSDAEWYARQLGRIADAEDLLSGLTDDERPKQQHRVAGLKAALAKGRARLSEIAKAAAANRRKH